jgi:UDP-N-acetylmuramoyl-tripeptide--D-alanyl-D-alanine ligase
MSMGTLGMVAESVNGVLHGRDRHFDAVSTDTRSLRADELFVALTGPNFDAAEFVADAERLGAAGAVVQRPQAGGLSQVVVADTRQALADLARAWRGRFELPVVGVTGSNGKTTVKELTAAILREHAGEDSRVLATRGNLNNEIGLPMMVLELRAHHRYAVLEMGASAVGEIAFLAAVAQPTIGIVTNAGPAHLEGFGSIAGVARGKGEMFAALPRDGTAIINRDDPFYDEWRATCPGCGVLSFGLAGDADVHAHEILEAAGGLEFILHGPGRHFPVRLPMAGQHNVRNALAAAAAAMAAGVGPEAIQRGLAAAANPAGRLRRLQAASGAVVFDDSYNANPASVRAAIEFLAAQPGEKWLVLGDMLELGPDSERLHGECGRAARDAGVDRLLCVGPLSRSAAAAFGAGAHHFDSRDELVQSVVPELGPAVTALVKGSRSMGMERVAAGLAAAGAED